MATAENTAPVLAVAAVAQEFRGLLKRSAEPRDLRWPLSFARETSVGGNRWLLLANGPGPRLAAEAMRVALEHGREHGKLRAVVSTGYCGALDPALRAGEVFVATEVVAAPGGARYAAGRPLARLPYASGPLVSLDRVAVTAGEKARLYQDGCAAVEMEAAAVARAAGDQGLPFYCIRAVSDTAEEDMPLDFNQYRDRDGRFQNGRIAVSALLRPSRLPGLVRLARASGLASANLGEFLACCPF